MHLYGNDLSEDTTPIEAGLAWSVAKDKTADYNGKKVIMNQLKDGINKKLIGLKMLDRNIARHGYEVYYNNEKLVRLQAAGFHLSEVTILLLLI